MKKEIYINNTRFDFLYPEGLSLWKLVENEQLVLGQIMDLEMYSDKLGKNIDRNNVRAFVTFLQRNKVTFTKILHESSIALKGLFNAINQHSFTSETKSNISFKLSDIDYKGCSEIINQENEFDLIFFPFNIQNKFMDIGGFVWRAIYRRNNLLGVFCDRV